MSFRSSTSVRWEYESHVERELCNNIKLLRTANDDLPHVNLTYLNLSGAIPKEARKMSFKFFLFKKIIISPCAWGAFNVCGKVPAVDRGLFIPHKKNNQKFDLKKNLQHKIFFPQYMCRNHIVWPITSWVVWQPSNWQSFVGLKSKSKPVWCTM